MIMKRIYMFAVALACTVSAFAQDIPFDKNYFQNQKDAFKVANTNFKDGESYFNKEFYYEALQYYLEAQTFNPSYSTLNYRIGVCYMNLPMKYKSLQYFEKAYQLRRDVAEDIHLMLARAYHLNGEFDKAIGEYKAHMAVLKPTDAAEMKPQLEKYIAECECGKQLMDNPARAFIDNAGSVLNSRFNDHSPLISADESMMIFTSTRNNGRTMSLEDGQYDEDIYISVGEKKNWQVPNEIGEPINTQFDDATVGLFPDGQQLLIYNGRKGFCNYCLSSDFRTIRYPFRIVARYFRNRRQFTPYCCSFCNFNFNRRKRFSRICCRIKRYRYHLRLTIFRQSIRRLSTFGVCAQ